MVGEKKRERSMKGDQRLTRADEVRAQNEHRVQHGQDLARKGERRLVYTPSLCSQLFRVTVPVNGQRTSFAAVAMAQRQRVKGAVK